MMVILMVCMLIRCNSPLSVYLQSRVANHQESLHIETSIQMRPGSVRLSRLASAVFD